MSTTAERRRHPRTSPAGATTITVECEQRPPLTGRVVDCSDGGLGLELPAALPEGATVCVAGDAIGTRRRVRVCWAAVVNGVWRAGVQFATDDATASEAPELDHYEALQLSPNADADTVQRVFRLLAQRYHPDNRETGDAAVFRQLVEAHRVLSDPEKRAAYDAVRDRGRERRWRIYDQPAQAQGVEARQRQRRGILGVLYAQRAAEPDKPAVSLMDLEKLLNVPREHLEFSIWYLKENGLVARADNGKLAITAKGVDAAEEAETSEADRPLLPAAS